MLTLRASLWCRRPAATCWKLHVRTNVSGQRAQQEPPVKAVALLKLNSLSPPSNSIDDEGARLSHRRW